MVEDTEGEVEDMEGVYGGRHGGKGTGRNMKSRLVYIRPEISESNPGYEQH